MEIKFLPRAERDLLALPAPLQDEILHKIEILPKFPEMGIKLERAFEGFRCILAGKNRYRILYRLKSAELIEVAYIRHCRRQMGLRLMKS